jgi:hypothetical protein
VLREGGLTGIINADIPIKKSKEKVMKKILLLTMACLLIAGPVFAAGLEVNQKKGDLTINVQMDKNPPVIGINRLDVAITDSGGKNVTDAKVRVNYSMPAMPGMAPMNYNATAKLADGKYSAKLNISMAGPWNIVVKVTRGKKTSTVKFNVDAQ